MNTIRETNTHYKHDVHLRAKSQPGHPEHPSGDDEENKLEHRKTGQEEEKEIEGYGPTPGEAPKE